MRMIRKSGMNKGIYFRWKCLFRKKKLARNLRIEINLLNLNTKADVLGTELVSSHRLSELTDQVSLSETLSISE